MKSVRAKEFIEIKDFHGQISKNIFVHIKNVIEKHYAIESVKIAEEEMIEKAIEAHRLSCKDLNIKDKTNCYISGLPCIKHNCDYKKIFIRILNN